MLTALDATALADRVRSRELASRQLIEVTLDRIEELEPQFNAYRIVLADEARAEADRLDRLSGGDLAALPLAGVPVAIKDDTDVAGQVTMWGSAVDRGMCTADAEVVARLRRAGAIIIGKTNVPELTLWPWTASERWGVTRNPWNLDRTPGGSSGGSAAAVCTGMAAMALGSDGGGSVRYPAGLTGLVGVKPQRERVPLGTEHASGWHGLIALGPLTRSVRDAALFLEVAAGGDLSGAVRDVAEASPARLRLVVSTNPPPGSQASLGTVGRQTVEEAAELLADLGHDVIRADIDYGLAALWNSTVRLLRGVVDDVDSMPERDRLEARTRSVARLGAMLPARSRRRALECEQRLTQAMNTVFENADVVLTPLCASPAPLISACPSSGALRSLRASNTSAWLVPWNMTGQPAMTVPFGLDGEELPTAIQLVGRHGDEVTILTLANEIEAVRPFPRWTPTSPIG